MREKVPHKCTVRKVKTSEFFATHPVFSLDEATNAFMSRRGRSGTIERLKYHLDTGRLKLVTRGIYAVVPPGLAAEGFSPDPMLVAAAVRPRGVFSHHSALELLGVAHSAWQQCTMYVERRRRPLVINGVNIRFLSLPIPMRTASRDQFGTRKVERREKLLRTTGPERTLVEGFRRPSLAGGLEELVLSAGGFPTLDLDLLEEILRRYNIANLWAATGWFLERNQRVFHVPDEFLQRVRRRCPRSPQYLERGRRGGALAPGWNLILPQTLSSMGEPDER